MTLELEIRPVASSELETVLPMIAAYQRFYEVADIDDERNRAFFARFLEPSEDGLLLAAWHDEDLAGFACMYWSFSSTLAAETVLMNDLYVREGLRGAGIGRGLIDRCVQIARTRGARHVEWATAPDNDRAQRLYDSTGAERSVWVYYELKA